MYWFPKSKIGKISFWLGISAFILLYLQYWAAMIFSTSLMLPGILVMICILVAGVMSVIAIIRYKERAILILVPLLIGFFGIMFVVGEFLFPH